MRSISIIFVIMIFGISSNYCQVAFNSSGTTPNNSAMLDVSSTTEGVLFTRMTIMERDLISSPAIGLIIFCIDGQVLQIYNGTTWSSLNTESCSPQQPGSITGNIIPVPNATGEAYSIDAIDGATTYYWIVPSGASIESGQGTTNIIVDFGIVSGNIYVRAESGCGVSTYSSLAIILTPWSCGYQFTDSRDGQSYNTVLIGSQCWMGENLNVGSQINGSSNQSNNGVIEKYCYGNTADNCTTYGGLYQWNEMMAYTTTSGTQGICPTDWHLPTDAEWCTLENEVDEGTISCSATGYRGIDAGGNLKETGTTHWNSPNTGATNSSGFSGMPGGYNNSSGTYLYIGNYGYFWTSTQGATNAWYRWLNNNSSQVFRDYVDKGVGFSVRCIKD